MTTAFKLIVLTCCVLSLEGCTSMITHGENREERRAALYPGVRADCQYWGLFPPYYLTDLPFSAVVDTLWLPYDVIAVACFKHGISTTTTKTNDTAAEPPAH